MKRSAKRIVVAAAVAAVSFQCVSVASACGGRGRSSANYGRPAYIQPVCSQPTYRQPAYPQPSYAPPVYHQPAQPDQVTQRQLIPTPPAAIQPRSQAMVASPAAQGAAQTLATGRPVSVSAAASRPVSAQRVTTQPAAVQQSGSQQANAPSAATADAELSALAALASIARAQTSATTSQPAAQPASQPTVQATVPQFSTAPTAAPSTTTPHVGRFQASLPSNATIELNLEDSGTFSWVVRNNGKTTQFSGQYRVGEGRLTLVRSNDLQQMAGKLTAAENGFTFKLDGGNNGGLNFKKV